MYYSIYYMTTPRCILNCGYCFRDSDILTNYSGWDELAEKCAIDRAMIDKYHSIGGTV